MGIEESKAAMAAIPSVPIERCPLCKAPASASWVREIAPLNVPWARCNACGLDYRQESPDQEAVAKFYESEYRDPKYPVLHDRVVQLTRAERTVVLLKDAGVLKVKRALDYGCANGVVLEELRGEYGCDVVGVELNKRDQKIAKGRGITIHPTIETVKGKFDLIVMTHVLEHIPGPVEFLQMLREKYAEPGCSIFFEMPGQTAVGSWAIFHVTCWTPATFAVLLMNSGWVPVGTVDKDNGTLFWALGRNGQNKG